MEFKKIWSIREEKGDSEIDLIELTNGKKILNKKYYTNIIPREEEEEEEEKNPVFNIEDIKKYHKIQNETKLVKNKLILNEPVTLLGNKINIFIVDILKLDEKNILQACDLKTRIEVIITTPEYIEGIKGKDTFNEYLKFIEARKGNELKKIIQDNIVSDKMYYPINSGGFELSQLSTFNIKVLSIENGIMKLLITDLANKIKEIIKK